MSNINIRKALLEKIFQAAYMQRWNDKLRPIDLIELDKQAHKMIIAYFLGKFEENTNSFNWIDVIEGGFFELLQRIVVTDLKPPIFYKIKKDPDKYRKLNEWVDEKLRPILSPLGDGFCKRFKDYFSNSDDSISKKILSAAHFYASRWELEIIKQTTPMASHVYQEHEEIDDIEDFMVRNIIKYYDELIGIRKLYQDKNIRKFLSVCGQLRFQSRWSHLHRIPRTSVLGQSLFVAIISYLLSLQIDACKKRCINNYFTGLFHDLPEVLTRDISSPVKKSIEGLADILKEYENEKMTEEILPIIPKEWRSEFRLYTGTLEEYADKESEFYTVITEDGEMRKVTSQEINEKYNNDDFNPRDGELVEAADHLIAFIEAYEARKNGCISEEFENAIQRYKEKYRNKEIAGVSFGEIYADF